MSYLHEHHLDAHEHNITSRSEGDAYHESRHHVERHNTSDLEGLRHILLGVGLHGGEGMFAHNKESDGEEASEADSVGLRLIKARSAVDVPKKASY